MSSLLPSCSSKYWLLDYLNMREYTFYSVTFNFYYANTTSLSTYTCIISNKTHPAFFSSKHCTWNWKYIKTKHVNDAHLYNLLNKLLRKCIIKIPLQHFPWPWKLCVLTLLFYFDPKICKDDLVSTDKGSNGPDLENPTMNLASLHIPLLCIDNVMI